MLNEPHSVTCSHIKRWALLNDVVAARCLMKKHHRIDEALLNAADLHMTWN